MTVLVPELYDHSGRRSAIRGDGGVVVKALKRAFWALDRYFGGDRPPLRPRGRFLRHPLLCGFAGALFAGGLCALALGRVDLQIALYSMVMGAFSGLLVIGERKRLDHYGYRWRKARDG
ncbi:hypothetical protein ACF08B_30270 [Streptomyces sp. NPDC015139]|uniref:hypothetical protein n=1 Tax=Streptomyces sp. NPDC015139 TaxID=3364942 RepID=UPI0036F772BE